MEEKNLNSWCEFEKEILRLKSQRHLLCQRSSEPISPLLFRGQQNAEWKLESTLERFTAKSDIPAIEYFELADKARPQIETYTGKRWEIDRSQFDKWNEQPNLLFPKSFPAQEYLIYLRHYGFPSPLLDWTKSPFVAAYFAFNKSSDPATMVSIYAYIEWAGVGKAQDGANPVISSLPINIPSHRRHYVQQSEYTICASETNSSTTFRSHEDGLSLTESGENLLWKFNLPSFEQIKVLRDLDQMNINSLSLFDNEEGLMETVALRVFYLENDNL